MAVYWVRNRVFLSGLLVYALECNRSQTKTRFLSGLHHLLGLVGLRLLFLERPKRVL